MIYRSKTWYYVTFEKHVILPSGNTHTNKRSAGFARVSTGSLQVQFLGSVLKRTIKPVDLLIVPYPCHPKQKAIPEHRRDKEKGFTYLAEQSHVNAAKVFAETDTAADSTDFNGSPCAYAASVNLIYSPDDGIICAAPISPPFRMNIFSPCVSIRFQSVVDNEEKKKKQNKNTSTKEAMDLYSRDVFL